MSNIIYIVIFIAFIFIAYNGYEKFKEWQNNNSMPIVNVKAIVIDKKQEDNNKNMDLIDDSKREMKNEDRYDRLNDTYLIAFQDIQTKENMHFNVKEEIYENVNKNQEGILTYQGTRFHGFVAK